MIRVAINGFGRIGRNFLRAGWNEKDIKIVAINDLTDNDILAHLLQYDTVHGTWQKNVTAHKDDIMIGKTRIPVYAQKDPSLIPWDKHDVDVVIESTGFFTKAADAKAHIKAGAKRVLISAPSKDAPTFLNSVNDEKISAKKPVMCMASCTTNSVGSIMTVLRENFGVQKAMLTTIHAATAGQNVVDGLPSRRKPDLRRARSVFGNIIPTSTGAAKATAKAIPALKGKFDGVAVRVPMPDMALSDITILLRKNTTVEDVNKVFKKAARLKRWKGILDVTNEPLVSSDFINNPHGAIVDLQMTRLVDGNLLKVMAWYDNEWGYSSQLVRMVVGMKKSLR